MPNGNGTKTYGAKAERDGHGWSVRVEGLSGPDRVYARDLADVEPRVQKLVAAYTGDENPSARIDLEVGLPPVVQDRLDVIGQLCEDIQAEHDAAVAELAEMGLSLLDVGRVLRMHHRLPRPLIVTNAEIAEHGLTQHPDAVGVVWSDHGQFETWKCREHVEATRHDYRRLPPEGENGVVYDIAGLHCDFCDDGAQGAVGW